MINKLLTLKNIIIAVLALFIIFGSLHTCNVNKQKDEQITQLQLDKQKLDSTVNKRGQIILQQEVIITYSSTELKNLSDSFFAQKRKDERKIKDVIAFYKGITKTKLDTVVIPYVDTLATHKFEDSIAEQCAQVIDYYEHNYISVPRTAEDSTADYKVSVDIRRENARFSVSIPDSQYIRFVTLKGGLLKKDISGKRHFLLKKQVTVQVLHTNKKITVTGQNSALYVPPNKPHWFLKAIIFAGGVFLGTKL